MDKGEIIGYYDYYFDRYEYSRIGKGKGKLNVSNPVNDIEKFLYNDKNCPFCRGELKKVFMGTQTATMGTDLYYSGDVFECSNCGWWTYKTHFSDSDDSIGEIRAVYTDERYYAITKSYNVDDKSLPIEVLSNELNRKPEVLYSINPNKLEELSQTILRGVYDCEVHHVGKTGDGGIDLIVLESDNPILVQVKRRQHPNHVELVKSVREFVGTLYIEDKRKGIFISTAKKFSKGSKDVAKRLIDDRKLDYFELIDYDKLCSLIKVTGEHKPWKKLVDTFYSNKISSIYDTEEAISQFDKKIKNYK